MSSNHSTTSPPVSARINVDGLGRLPAFSHAARAGDTIYVSGTLGTVGDGFELAPDGIGPQTRQALENIGRILEAAGGSYSDVVNVRVFLVDMGDFALMNEAYLEFFPDDPPSRITVGCSALALGAGVEIEAIAYVPLHSIDPPLSRTDPNRTTR